MKFPFCQYVCKLVFGVDILDLNLGIQISSVKQPVKSNSLGSGYMSHRWTPTLDDHFNHGFIILKDVQHRMKSRKLLVEWHTINIVQIKIVVLVGTLVLFWVCLFDAVSRERFPCT